MLWDSLEGWGVGRGHRRQAQREGTRVYLWLIRVDVWQEPAQYCTATILQ